ncbi:MAG: hypothetical protein ACTSVU_06880 [Promethearchaeota archaeon]
MPKKLKKTKLDNNAQIIDEMHQKENTIEIQTDGKKILSHYTFEELSSEKLSESQCKELRGLTFSNDPKNFFLEIRSLEERYTFEVESVRKEWNEKIALLKAQNEEEYKNAIKNKKKELEHRIEHIKEEIAKSLSSLELQKQMSLSQIDMIYKLNKQKLFEKFLNIMGLDF